MIYLQVPEKVLRLEPINPYFPECTIKLNVEPLNGQGYFDNTGRFHPPMLQCAHQAPSMPQLFDSSYYGAPEDLSICRIDCDEQNNNISKGVCEEAKITAVMETPKVETVVIDDQPEDMPEDRREEIAQTAWYQQQPIGVVDIPDSSNSMDVFDDFAQFLECVPLTSPEICDIKFLKEKTDENRISDIRPPVQVIDLSVPDEDVVEVIDVTCETPPPILTPFYEEERSPPKMRFVAPLPCDHKESILKQEPTCKVEDTVQLQERSDSVVPCSEEHEHANMKSETRNVESEHEQTTKQQSEVIEIECKNQLDFIQKKTETVNGVGEQPVEKEMESQQQLEFSWMKIESPKTGSANKQPEENETECQQQRDFQLKEARVVLNRLDVKEYFINKIRKRIETEQATEKVRHPFNLKTPSTSFPLQDKNLRRLQKEQPDETVKKSPPPPLRRSTRKRNGDLAEKTDDDEVRRMTQHRFSPMTLNRMMNGPKVVLEKLRLDDIQKCVLANIPGMSDLELIQPERNAAIVQVVQVPGGNYKKFSLFLNVYIVFVNFPENFQRISK